MDVTEDILKKEVMAVDEECLRVKGYVLTEDQKKALITTFLAECSFVFVTGFAGAGKSVFIWALCQLAYRLRLRYIVTSTTGKAAQNIGGVTLFQALNRSPENISDRERFYDPSPYFKEADIIIIDEASMMSRDLFGALCQAWQYRQKIVFAGDLAQLPAVDTGIGKGVYADFRRLLFSVVGKSMAVVNLNTVMRQQDKKWQEYLRSIRRGICPEGINDYLTKAYYLNTKLDGEYYALCAELLKYQAEGKNVQVVAATNKMCEKINSICQELSGKKKEDFRTYDVIRSEKPLHNDIPEELRDKIRSLIEDDKRRRKDDYKPVTLCPGQRVMIIVNEKAPAGKKRLYANGSEGFVEALAKDYVAIRLMESDTIVNVEYRAARNCVTYEGLDSRKHTFCYEAVDYMPVIGSNAITIHRSQGQTVDIMYVDPRGCSQPGHMYVALSRTRTPEGIRLLAPIKPEYVKADPHVNAYYDFIEFYGVGYDVPILSYLEERFLEADRFKECCEKRKELEAFDIPELLEGEEKISYSHLSFGENEDEILCMLIMCIVFDNLYGFMAEYEDPRAPYIISQAIGTRNVEVLKAYLSGEYDRYLGPEAEIFSAVEMPDIPLSIEDAVWELFIYEIMWDESDEPTDEELNRLGTDAELFISGAECYAG